MNSVIDKYDAALGAAIAFFAAIFGEFWFLLALYLLFQILDWLTGWRKAYLLGRESSRVGFAGILKKLGYWAVIIVGFGFSLALRELSQKLGLTSGINIQLIMGLGWFVLASLLVNEARSILENLVEIGYKIPLFLVKGLAVTDRLINTRANGLLDENRD